MNLNDIDFEHIVYSPQFKSPLAFTLDGMTADEYIAKLTDENNKITLESIPIDKWDMIVTFALATLEVAGDFFIGDPGFKYSLANSNGPFVKWLNHFHQSLDHTGQPIDFQGKVIDASGNIAGSLGGGAHRGKTFAHDLPLARFLFGTKVDEKDTTSTKAIKHTYNGALIAHDLLCFTLSLFSICSGNFIDCVFSKEGAYELIKTGVNQNGTPYEPCNIFIGVVKYLVHMLADFCSSASLPIPGWSMLAHFPDRDVEAFALRLYKNGMNLRTLAMQGIPVGVTELLMALYIWMRSKNNNDNYSEEAWQNKKDKLLLIAHGITAAVNVGKVIITKAPWRLNLVVIIRTFYLIWKVINDESILTNNHILKLDSQILRARIESSKTLVLLDELMYETDNLNLVVDELQRRVEKSVVSRRKQLDALNREAGKLDKILED